jgi:hypothetical protein
MTREYSENLRRIAWTELNYLAAQGGVSPALRGARISERPTAIYDLNGEEIYHRVPLTGERGAAGYADIATHPAFGEPLLAVAEGLEWDEHDLRAQAYKAAFELAERDMPDLSQTEMRFVAYSYPKLAVQFLLEDKEVLMLELYSWQPVPRDSERKRDDDELGLRRQSLLETLPRERRETAEAVYRSRDKAWGEIFDDNFRARLGDISTHTFLDVAGWTFLPLYGTRELHYSKRNSDHKVCYEVRGQETSVWCVGASVQMMLDFYRYEYSQTRLAVELGLGTPSNPNGLPYSQIGKIEQTLEKLSNNALSATLINNPDFNDFKSEIDANRPILSIVPGHARTVAGYYQSYISLLPNPPFKGLLVYDPWPPTTGVVTRWENFNTTSYQYAVRANVTLV